MSILKLKPKLYVHFDLNLNPMFILKLCAALRRACIDTVRTDQQAQRDQSLLEKMNPLS